MIYDLNHRVMASQILSRLKTRNNNDEQGGSVVIDQSFSHVQLFVTPVTAAQLASLSFTTSQSWPKLMPMESVRPSSHPVLCRCLSTSLQSFPAQGLLQGVISLTAQGVGTLPQADKGVELQLQHQSFQWIFMVDFL